MNWALLIKSEAAVKVARGAKQVNGVLNVPAVVGLLSKGDEHLAYGDRQMRGFASSPSLTWRSQRERYVPQGENLSSTTLGIANSWKRSAIPPDECARYNCVLVGTYR